MRIRDDELLKIKVLIKAYLVTHPGRHTAGEIASWINSYDFGIVHGVTATEIGIIIKNYASTGFLRCIRGEKRYRSGGRKEYFVEGGQ